MALEWQGIKVMQIGIVFFILIYFSQANAERHERFSGIAEESGKVVYIENHDVIFDDAGQALEATTLYTAPDGKILGKLKSDFRNSLSLPEHIFYDERTKGSYGIRRAGSKIILFNRDEGKAEQSLELTDKSEKERIQVGCQGFNYFLKNKLEELKSAKVQPVLFMVPGDLSTYKFVLEFVSENSDKTLYFKVKIENWFLRAFAPELEFRYDPKLNRIVWYKGISNIKNESGQTRNVEINYKYL